MKPRGIVLDIDGTLVRWRSSSYVYDFLLSRGQLARRNAEARRRYEAGRLSYAAWHEQLFRWLKADRVTELGISAVMRANLHPQTPSPASIQALCNRFEFSAILSGSLINALDVASISVRSFDCTLAHELFFDEAGQIKSWRVNPFGTGGDKVRGLDVICSTLNCVLSELVYVGDGSNDLEVINELNRAGGMGFALPPLADEASRLIHPGRRVASIEELARMRFYQ